MKHTHIYPMNDIIEHKFNNKGDCPCNPEFLFEAGDEDLMIIVHSAMDGRPDIERPEQVPITKVLRHEQK